MTVVSGKPISFLSRLYEPRYIRARTSSRPRRRRAAGTRTSRPLRRLPPGSRSVVGARLCRPARNDEPASVDGVPAVSPGRRGRRDRRPPRCRLGGGFGRGEYKISSSVEPDTGAQEVGELFEYHFSRPASVKAGESLLLPFVQQKITARQVYIWDSGEGVHPQRAAKLTNSTGKTLDGGPVTVYTPEGYTGESLMSTFKAGDKRFLSFAIDLGTRVTTKFDTGAQIIRSFKAEHGLLTTKSSSSERTTYTVSNVDAHVKNVLIAHPVRFGDGSTLVSPKPEEKTAERYSSR